MKQKGCPCRMCRHGLHRPYGKYTARQITHKARRIVRDTIKKGNLEKIDELPISISRPYTD